MDSDHIALLVIVFLIGPLVSFRRVRTKRPHSTVRTKRPHSTAYRWMSCDAWLGSERSLHGRVPGACFHCGATRYRADDYGGIYSSRLKGLEGPECPTPKCWAKGHMVSTGWLVFDTTFERWDVEYECPIVDHDLVQGRGPSPLFEEVMAEKGLRDGVAPGATGRAANLE